MDQAHLVEALDGVLRRLGGTARAWRTDRLATVIVPGSADVQASFAPVAKHYGVVIRPCPPRRGNRKGAVEASVRYAVRTLVADDERPDDDRGPGQPRPLLRDRRRRATGGRSSSVGALADAEPLLPLPPVPTPRRSRSASRSTPDATVAFRGARYSVPPGLIGAGLTVRHRLGSSTLEILASVRHARGPSPSSPRAGSCGPPSTGPPSSARSSARSPPCRRASARATIRPVQPPGPPPRSCGAVQEEREVVVDLTRYAELVEAAR